MKNANNKTLNQLLSVQRQKYEWLLKLKRNVEPMLKRLGDFQLPQNLSNVPKVPNTLKLIYVGEESPEAIIKARGRVEKVFQTIIDNNVVVAKCGRITMTITLVIPTVKLQEAA